MATDKKTTPSTPVKKAAAMPPPTDDRLKRSTAGDTRLNASEDRTEVDEREVQDDRRMEATVDDWSFDKLPQLPVIPGYKTIWLSSTHKQDTISRRMRLGYTPIRPEEAPDLKDYAKLSGDSDGVIQCEELQAFKLPEDKWLKYMTHFHHTKPLMDESGIKEEIERLQEQAMSYKGKIEYEGGADSGFRTMGMNRRPVFK